MTEIELFVYKPKPQEAAGTDKMQTQKCHVLDIDHFAPLIRQMREEKRDQIIEVPMVVNSAAVGLEEVEPIPASRLSLLHTTMLMSTYFPAL